MESGSSKIKPHSKIAIIGSGISGLGAAHGLHAHYDITLFEKNDYLGGHACTVTVPCSDGPTDVDMGFIVFNKRNYPLLTRLFQRLDVPLVESCMSFGVSIEDGWLEYGTRRPLDLFAQKVNLLRPSFWRMLRDIIHFNKRARKYLDSDPTVTMEDCLKAMGTGPWFRDYYLLAMGGAIWSMPLHQMLNYPASRFIRFFDQHGLLSINDHPQWYTVKGGSKAYVKRMAKPFKEKIRLGCGVKKVIRENQKVMVHDTQGTSHPFDAVIFACHSDQALALIENPTRDEKNILGPCRYQPNQVILHGDVRFMPRRQGAWSSWVYLLQKDQDQSKMCLSYWMNHLQRLETTDPLIVTLNPPTMPQENLIYHQRTFDHPVFDVGAINAQSQMGKIQGHGGLWFCGAYQRYGFHEDGLASAVQLLKEMGIPQWI